jgi:agmatine deiminase
MTLAETPRELGYRWPAEWEPHAATWLAWPRKPDTWPGRLEAAAAEFAEFARTLAQFEPVHILVGGDDVRRQAEKSVGACPQVTLWDIPANDSWIRDFGPIFLQRRNETAIVDWRYNAWGGKYPPFDDDDAAARRIHAALDPAMRLFSCPHVLEGGSVEGNGQGLMLTTRTCLLNPNRNPGLSRERIESLLRDYFAGRRIVWLDGEIAGDDTDGHVDQLARFVAPNVVLAASESDATDANFTSLRRLRRQLEATEWEHGGRLQVIDLPMPAPVFHQEHRLPASYANFYVANNVVLAPQFHDAGDRRACDILREHFPRREVVGLACRELIWGLGGFHCLTQQQPAAV